MRFLQLFLLKSSTHFPKPFQKTFRTPLRSRLLLKTLTFLISTVLSSFSHAFELKSADIKNGKFMSKAQEFQGFGCSGRNISPSLSWSGAPAETQAFAIFAYDPDAPTGSGWWHWQLVNVPANVNKLVSGAGDQSGEFTPDGAIHIKNDYGFKGFGGACPPTGHGVHRYQFTIYALSKVLDLPEDASGALTGYLVRANAIASDTIEALYKRD